MTLEWWNKVRMSLKLVILAQRDTITLDPPFVPTVCQKLMTFNGMGGLGLLLLWSLTNSGLWPPTPNFYSSRSSLGPKLTTLTLHWLLVTSQLVLDRLSKLLKAYNLQNSRSEAHPLTPYLSEKSRVLAHWHCVYRTRVYQSKLQNIGVTLLIPG